MKTNGITFLFAACIIMGTGCKKADAALDKDEIVNVLEGETLAFTKADFDAWSSFWKQDENIFFSYTVNNQSFTATDFETLAAAIKEGMALVKDVENHEFNREYHNLQIDGDLAWANFTQQDEMAGVPAKKMESKTLRRINGKWKLIGSTILDISSFTDNQYLLNANTVKGSTHIKVADFPKGGVINHVNGWGGMAVAINEMPKGTDFGVLLQGMEHNDCDVPHWGYMEKGRARMKYRGGAEEVIEAGEVFYMPPGHTGVLEADTKLIDFSPQEAFAEVISHVEQKVAEMQKE